MPLRLLAPLALALTLALALVVGIVGHAHACSCVEPRLERTHLPADGARDVPTDVTIHVFLRTFTDGARQSLGAEYRLRDAAGALVPLDATVVSDRLDLRPRHALVAHRTYTLEHVFAFGTDGARLTDTERFYARAGTVRGVFYPALRFTTGAGPLAARTASPTVHDATLHFAQGGGDCGPGAALSVAPAPIAARDSLDLIELRVRGLGVVTSAPATTDRLYASDLMCSSDPVTLPPGQSVEYQLGWLDASGRELGATAWATVQSSVRRRSRTARGPMLASPGWASTTIVPAPPPAPPSGPPGCENGLEETSRAELVATGAPWAFGDRAAIASDGATVWALYPGLGDDGAVAPLRAFAMDAARASIAATAHDTTLTGNPEVLTTTGHGLYAITRTWSRDLSATAQLTALAPSASGALGARWSAPIAGQVGRYRAAIHGNQLAIAYGRRAPDYSESLSLVRFDLQRGVMLEPVLDTAQGLDTNAEGPAIAAVGEGFLVVWPSGQGLISRGPLRTASFGAGGLGAIVDLAVPSYSPPSLIGAGSVAGLATGSERGVILVSVLDASGHLSAGPFEVSRGIGGDDNRNPVVAWDGRRFGVLWETHPDTGAYVAVVDPSGHVSAALRIDRAEVNASGLGLVATTRGFVATYTGGHGDHGMAVSLACRASAPAGPPASIDPA
ncbi:MAG: Ig-like domain-containing protein [Sandaracinaceae bacterium]|nr:Ig-like domain-containing protein [Sandaracinaceae bacterium]